MNFILVIFSICITRNLSYDNKREIGFEIAVNVVPCFLPNNVN